MRDGAIILGTRRAGSTLAFKLVRELMATELQTGALRRTYAGDAADRFVETAPMAGSAFVLKTPASGTRVNTLIAASRVAAIYTRRDPRDAIVSIMNFLKSTFTEAMEVGNYALSKFEQNWKGDCLEISYPEFYPLTATLISGLRIISIYPARVNWRIVWFTNSVYSRFISLRASLQISRMNSIFAIWTTR